MSTQAEKGLAFRRLHERNAAFIIPNPWDIGSARILEHMGFEALATTSMGYAFSIGKLDTTVGRDEMLAHIATIADATSLPVNADLENGYGDDPRHRCRNDSPCRRRRRGRRIDRGRHRPCRRSDLRHRLAVERVRAAVAAARALPFPFTLTARAENYLHGRPDLDDTIRRLKAFEDAGADVLYAPGLRSKDDIAAVVKSRAAAGECADGTAGRAARAPRSCRRSARGASALAARSIARRWARSFAPPTRCATRARSSSPPTPPTPGTSPGSSGP